MAKQTFESAIARLEEITSQLEEGTLSLDISLKLYEESHQLLAFCMEKLKQANEKIKVLNKTSEGFELDEAELD